MYTAFDIIMIPLQLLIIFLRSTTFCFLVRPVRQEEGS